MRRMSPWSLTLFVLLHCCYRNAISTSSRESYSSRDDVQPWDATNTSSLRGRDVALDRVTEYTELLLGSRMLSAEGESKPEGTAVKGYSLPLMPATMPDISAFSSNPHLKQIKGTATTDAKGDESKDGKGSSDKLIPRLIWIAVKDRRDALPGHLTNFFSRNPTWTVNICDNECKDHFMSSAFGGTSIGWAYSAINPLLGAARADIWRYCILYSFGGLYMDDDSDVATPLDQIVAPTDHMIMSEEGKFSMGSCYVPTFHLSDPSTFSETRYGLNYSKADFYTPPPPAVPGAASVPVAPFSPSDPSSYPQFFHFNSLVNWGIFVRPLHPLLLGTMGNIASVISAEYRRDSLLTISRWDLRWKLILCSTNFIMTFTLREMALGNSPEYQASRPRILMNNFKQYGGNVKAIQTNADPTHYVKAMQSSKLTLLHRYEATTLAFFLASLEGKSIIGDSPDKAIYLVSNGTRRMFPDYDTYLSYNFSPSITKHVKNQLMLTIPIGGALPSVLRAIGPTAPAPVSTAAVSVQPSLVSGPLDIPFLNSLKATFDSGTPFNMSCWRDDYAGSRDDYLEDRFKSLLGARPVMVFPMCLRLFQLGNAFGYYFNDIACAASSGSHFIAVMKQFSLIESDRLAAPPSAHFAFFDALPTVISHPLALSPTEAKLKMKQECPCLQYCWENPSAPWLRHIPLVRSILLPAIDAYLAVADTAGGTRLSNVTDVSTVPFLSFSSMTVSPLPIIPHVSVQYRCGDNIGFGKVKYGLLPFPAILSRIPVWARSIYVMADSPSRNSNHPFSSRCGVILKGLFDAISKEFPLATVVVKRGGDQFLDYARLAYSNVTICSASTFCLWPALANSNDVYFPLTALIANSGSNETAKDLGSRFHWIRDIEMLRNFKQFRPWNQVMDVLEGRQKNY